MADWRQIQARIRKARSAPDSTGQLGELYERTRDAMVAFELGKAYEKAGDSVSAVRWYTTSYERFRRAQWRTKAQEALVRLGAPVPELSQAPAEAGGQHTGPVKESHETPASVNQMDIFAPAFPPNDAASAAPAISAREDQGQAPTSAEEPGSPPQSGSPIEANLRPRRRGHRGGRGRRRGGRDRGAQASPRSADRTSAPPPSTTGGETTPVSVPYERAHTDRWEDRSSTPAREIAGGESVDETPPVRSGLQLRGRAGDPGLSSRISQLESQLRRLLASDLHSMDEAAQAPAGPGVFLVTDTDQTSYYHVEACQTLRIGIGNLLRVDRRSPRGTETLRSRFADHLGVTESQVGKYLEKHCGVRWLQLDEGAANLAHFAVAVLRPVLDQS